MIIIENNNNNYSRSMDSLHDGFRSLSRVNSVTSSQELNISADIYQHLLGLNLNLHQYLQSLGIHCISDPTRQYQTVGTSSDIRELQILIRYFQWELQSISSKALLYHRDSNTVYSFFRNVKYRILTFHKILELIKLINV